jgi:hypothetical protein
MDPDRQHWCARVVYTGAFTDRETDQVVEYTDYMFVGQYLPYYICDTSVTYPGSATPSGTCYEPDLKRFLVQQHRSTNPRIPYFYRCRQASARNRGRVLQRPDAGENVTTSTIRPTPRSTPTAHRPTHSRTTSRTPRALSRIRVRSKIKRFSGTTFSEPMSNSASLVK